MALTTVFWRVKLRRDGWLRVAGVCGPHSLFPLESPPMRPRPFPQKAHARSAGPARHPRAGEPRPRARAWLAAPSSRCSRRPVAFPGGGGTRSRAGPDQARPGHAGGARQRTAPPGRRPPGAEEARRRGAGGGRQRLARRRRRGLGERRRSRRPGPGPGGAARPRGRPCPPLPAPGKEETDPPRAGAAGWGGRSLPASHLRPAQHSASPSGRIPAVCGRAGGRAGHVCTQHVQCTRAPPHTCSLVRAQRPRALRLQASSSDSAPAVAPAPWAAQRRFQGCQQQRAREPDSQDEPRGFPEEP